MKIRTFQFFRGRSLSKWEEIGMIGEADNPDLLINVLDLTMEYLELQTNDVYETEQLWGLMYPIMYRLYIDKHNNYTDNEITLKIVMIVNWIRSNEYTIQMNDIRETSLIYNIDFEMYCLTAQIFNWNE